MEKGKCQIRKVGIYNANMSRHDLAAAAPTQLALSFFLFLFVFTENVAFFVCARSTTVEEED